MDRYRVSHYYDDLLIIKYFWNDVVNFCFIFKNISSGESASPDDVGRLLQITDIRIIQYCQSQMFVSVTDNRSPVGLIK